MAGLGPTYAASIWPAYIASIAEGPALNTYSFMVVLPSPLLVELLPDIAFWKCPFANPIITCA